MSGGRLGRDAGDQITGQVADSERPGIGRDAGGGRGLGRDKMPAGAEAGTGTRYLREPRPGLGQNAGEGRG